MDTLTFVLVISLVGVIGVLVGLAYKYREVEKKAKDASFEANSLWHELSTVKDKEKKETYNYSVNVEDFGFMKFENVYDVRDYGAFGGVSDFISFYGKDNSLVGRVERDRVVSIEKQKEAGYLDNYYQSYREKIIGVYEDIYNIKKEEKSMEKEGKSTSYEVITKGEETLRLENVHVVTFDHEMGIVGFYDKNDEVVGLVPVHSLSYVGRATE